MIVTYKNRGVEKNQKILIYRNLHKDCFSVADSQSKKVIAHGDGFLVKFLDVKVSEKGRERVREQKRKEVHAYIKGVFLKEETLKKETIQECNECYYNPYTTDTFINKKTKEVMTNKEDTFLYFFKNKVYILPKKNN